MSRLLGPQQGPICGLQLTGDAAHQQRLPLQLLGRLGAADQQGAPIAAHQQIPQGRRRHAALLQGQAEIGGFGRIKEKIAADFQQG